MRYWHIDDDWRLFVVTTAGARPDDKDEVSYIFAKDMPSAVQLADEVLSGVLLSVVGTFGAVVAPHVPVEEFLYLVGD